MTIKEKVKKEIEQLTTGELEMVYLYLTSVKMNKKGKTSISSLSLKGKLDAKNIRTIAHD